MKRRWELLVFVHIWHFWIWRGYGLRTPFMWETWIGPICLRVWADPRSISSVRRAVRWIWRR